jgi:hypothetical protein
MTDVSIFTGILFTAIGVFSLVSALCDWNWFFQSHNASFFVRTFGRRGARVFYALLGAGIIVVGLMMALGKLQ